MNHIDNEYPEGHFVGIWMAIFIVIFSGLGIPLSIVTENFAFIGIGPALGVAVGLAIGQSIENKYKQEGRIRPLSESEIKSKKIAVAAGIVVLMFGVLIFFLLYLL